MMRTFSFYALCVLIPSLLLSLLLLGGWDKRIGNQLEFLFNNEASTSGGSHTIILDDSANRRRRKLLENEGDLLQQDAGASSSSFTSSSSLNIFTGFLDTSSGRKQRETLLHGWEGAMGVPPITLVANTTKQQYAFLQSNPCTDGAAERFQLLHQSNHSHLAEELWKYCSLWKTGGLYLSAESFILNPSAFTRILRSTKNVRKRKNNDMNTKAKEDGGGGGGGATILMDSFAPNAMHGSLLFLPRAKSNVALEMAKLIVETNVTVLMESPLLLSHSLYDRVVGSMEEEQGDNHVVDWVLLQQSCSENPFRQKEAESQPMNGNIPNSNEIHNLYTCSRLKGLCCFVYYNNEDEEKVAVLASRRPLQPTQLVTFGGLPKPIQSESTPEEQLPFLATLRIVEERDKKGQRENQPVKTFYEELQAKDCLPSHSCNKCLADKKHGATCETCLEACPCFCKALCKDGDGDKENGKDNPSTGTSTNSLHYQEIMITRPRYARDPQRLIPRIIHQTFFERLDDAKKWPNMSRLTQSFKTSGWTYKFYTDEDAGKFLSRHFPPQVRQAYDLLLPGAFKADLFRYCCLLILGGVYADVDVLMGPSLDAAIPPDVGFIVGLDEPGKKIGKRHCVWNGFLASAPGHPFLAKAIENVVNNIHLRFTSVDVARAHCPSPEMSVITSFSPLFVAGPCMLGSTINRVLGHHGQRSFEAGTLPTANASAAIPGRTIILNQNKMDMGAHRFTNLEQNLIVFSTDFPDSDDREKLDDYEHYSETRVRFEIYGVDAVYKDNFRNSSALIRVNFN